MGQMFLALAALFLASLAAEAAPQVTVRAQVEISEQEMITLGDIAEFEGFSQERATQLKAVRLADAPVTGDMRVFTNSGLAQTLRAHIGSDEAGERIQFSIPARVVIKRKMEKFNEESVKSAILDQLKQVCQNCMFKLNRVSMPVVGLLPAGTTWNVKVRSEIPRGNFNYPIEINDGDQPQVFWVSGHVSIYKKVLVSKRNISLGEKISQTDYAEELRDVTQFSDSIANADDLATTMAARGISAEQIIGRSHLRKENAFKFGDIVKVVAGNESWQISIDGVAQQNAAVGETAKVKIPRTQKMLSGVVVEKGVVEVR